MKTFIIGETGKSLVANGMAIQIKKQGGKPFLFHEGATAKQIDKKQRKYTDIIVCWQRNVPEEMEDPDILIFIIKPKK